ncbi:MAG: hypothetical protein JW829_09250 [Pirellulales bacterium]|nr:hypothetical protein [Pirellulales bacterium]
MPIEFYCTGCGRILRVQDEDAGRDATCPVCGAEFVVPTPGRFPEADPSQPIGQTMPYQPVESGLAPIVPARIVLEEVLGRAWAIFKSQAGLLIGMSLLVMVINAIMEGGFDIMDKQGGQGVAPEFSKQLTRLLIFIVTVFLEIGQTKIILDICRGRPTSIGHLFSGGPHLLPILGAGILYALMVGFGLLLFIIPGIVLAIMFGRYYYLIIDRKTPVLDAFSISRQITAGNKWIIFGLWLVGILLIIAGLLACCVGIIVVIPYIRVAGVVAYLMMSGQSIVNPA